MIFFHFFRNTDRSFNKDYVEDLEGYLAAENFESPLVETQDKTKVPGSVQIDDSFAEKAAEDENHLGSLTAGDFPSDFSMSTGSSRFHRPGKTRTLQMMKKGLGKTKRLSLTSTTTPRVERIGLSLN